VTDAKTNHHNYCQSSRDANSYASIESYTDTKVPEIATKAVISADPCNCGANTVCVTTMHNDTDNNSAKAADRVVVTENADKAVCDIAKLSFGAVTDNADRADRDADDSKSKSTCNKTSSSSLVGSPFAVFLDTRNPATVYCDKPSDILFGYDEEIDIQSTLRSCDVPSASTNTTVSTSSAVPSVASPKPVNLDIGEMSSNAYAKKRNEFNLHAAQLFLYKAYRDVMSSKQNKPKSVVLFSELGHDL
jgi:hypothetical protein